ncbi:S9 family peptidase [Porticoccaceae bacterium LTM1]|nr:S9 family peptidase [Porticoccaceae bacterium LTM1]
MKQIAPYGSWKSPITPELITQAAPSLDAPQTDGDYLYWQESRPWESGRSVVMRRNSDGIIEDVLAAPLSAHSKVHEYGGGAWLVAEGVLYFCHAEDQRVYRLDLNSDKSAPAPMTPANSAQRFADLCLDTTGNSLIAVCEDHSKNDHEPTNSLVAIPLDGSQQIQTLVSGADFYSNPRISPDGKKLSWLCWYHPQMPWDGTELWLADLNNSLSEARCVAGGKKESIFEPQWSPNGQLYFVSDRSNWWNIYRLEANGETTAICPMDAEFATPQWVFGMSTYGFMDSETIACCYTQNGLWQLATIDLNSGSLTDIHSPYSDISAMHCAKGEAYFIGGSSKTAPAVARLTNGTVDVCYGSKELPFASEYLTTPEPISFPSGNNSTAHAVLYRPANSGYQAPEGELPPLMVMCHGGPTAATSTALNFKAQFWASRGFAVLDVNYRGSTGYGREYREALNGNWGIADVEDVVNGAQFLADQGIVDRERMAIRGGSAGGFTVLAALTFHDTFKAGASLYGIGDLELLAEETHKFESRYIDSMVGPYPETKATYIERSPINHIDQLASPVIFLQGLDDKVVPPSQAETMISALNEKQIPVAYVPLTGEGHGFRKAENIIRAYDSELYFYSRIFGFELAEPVEPIHIENFAE